MYAHLCVGCQARVCSHIHTHVYNWNTSKHRFYVRCNRFMAATKISGIHSKTKRPKKFIKTKLICSNNNKQHKKNHKTFTRLWTFNPILSQLKIYAFEMCEIVEIHGFSQAPNQQLCNIFLQVNWKYVLYIYIYIY